MSQKGESMIQMLRQRTQEVNDKIKDAKKNHQRLKKPILKELSNDKELRYLQVCNLDLIR
jgi:hypothetical protein